MSKNVFDLESLRMGKKEWTIKHCLNWLANLGNPCSVIRYLLEEGAVGGDVDWGIHTWDKYAEEDYGAVRCFDGYRYYIGERQHGIVGRGYIEEYTSRERLLELLVPILQVYIDKSPIEEQSIRDLAIECGIPL